RQDGQVQSAPAGAGVNWQEIILICGGGAAGHGLMNKFVVNPALDKFNLTIDRRLAEFEKGVDKRFTDARSAIDREFVRQPQREDDEPVKRRENMMLEEQARREHEILKEKIDEQGKRLDHEFGKVWGVLKRLVNRESDPPASRLP